jgi:hypothetical protein
MGVRKEEKRRAEKLSRGFYTGEWIGGAEWGFPVWA